MNELSVLGTELGKLKTQRKTTIDASKVTSDTTTIKIRQKHLS
jgi:hypothetical protein